MVMEDGTCGNPNAEDRAQSAEQSERNWISHRGVKLTARSWKSCFHREGGEGGEQVINFCSRVADRKLLCESNNCLDTWDRGSKRLRHHRSDSRDTLWRNDPDREWLDGIRFGGSKLGKNDEERKRNDEENDEGRERRHGGNQSRWLGSRDQSVNADGNQ
jgi:hypothetical protein